MKIISLSSLYPGYACGVADYLNRYNYKNERGFFDYLTVSIKNIIEVICNKDIQFENYEVSRFYIPNDTNNIFIRFKDFDNMISYHDFIDISTISIEYWTKFYKDMQYKLIHDIMNYNKIVFVRFCINQDDIFENDICTLFNTLEILNPNLNYFLILFTNCFIKIPDILNNNPRFIYLNFRLYNSIYKTYTFNIYQDLVNHYDTTCFDKIIHIIKQL